MALVALLRGINVGGKSKVEMAKLKATFESLGCKRVATYINSGNVIFQDARPIKQLVKIIEVAIKRDFGLEARIVIRDADNIRKLCEEIPDKWTNDAKQKTDVLFLWDEIDNKNILSRVSISPEIENARYVKGALVWNIGRSNVTRGGAIRLIKTDLYKHMTIRNINTVRKLDQLMQSIED